ncbi:hypothetical protein FOL47_010975 [Perkinsus chesapeaki]|uniref:Uncharacterized protein n=1 Tax=Perkinsus chesapeaki TaxID=330153 RepID=A0A7J6MNF0_PERCH|nr:hypothetical protein FOL47_010975 [Perkinsus chesapeaki]
MSFSLPGHSAALLAALSVRSAIEEAGIGGATRGEYAAIYGEELGDEYFKVRRRKAYPPLYQLRQNSQQNSSSSAAAAADSVFDNNEADSNHVGVPGSFRCDTPLPLQTAPVRVGTPASSTSSTTTSPQVTPATTASRQLEETQEPHGGGAGDQRSRPSELFLDDDDDSELLRTPKSGRTAGVSEGPDEVDPEMEDDEILESQLTAEIGDVYVPPPGTTPPWENPRRRRILNSPTAGRIECYFLEKDQDMIRVCEANGARDRWVPRERVFWHRGPAGMAEVFDVFGDGEEEDGSEPSARATNNAPLRRRQTAPSNRRGLRRNSSGGVHTPRGFSERNTMSPPNPRRGTPQRQVKRTRTSATTPTSARRRGRSVCSRTPANVDSTLQQWRLFEYLTSATPTQWMREVFCESPDAEVQRVMAEGFHGILPDDELVAMAGDSRQEMPLRIVALMALLSSGDATQNQESCRQVAALVIDELNSAITLAEIGVVILMAICQSISGSIGTDRATSIRTLTVLSLASTVRVRILWSVLSLALPQGLTSPNIEVSEEEILRDLRFKKATLGERLTGGLLVVCGKWLMTGSGPTLKIGTIIPWLVGSGSSASLARRSSEAGSAVVEPSEAPALLTRSDRFPKSAAIHVCRLMMSAGACTAAVDDPFTPTHPLQVEIYYSFLLQHHGDRDRVSKQMERWGGGSPKLAEAVLEILLRDFPQQCCKSGLWEKVENSALYRLVALLPGQEKLPVEALRRLTPPSTWPDRVRLSPCTVDAVWELSIAITNAACHSTALDDGSSGHELEVAVEFLANTLQLLIRSAEDPRPAVLLSSGGLCDDRHLMPLTTKRTPEPRPYWIAMSEDRLRKWYLKTIPESDFGRYIKDYQTGSIRPLSPSLFTKMSEKARRTAAAVAELFYSKLLQLWDAPDVHRGLHRARLLHWIFTESQQPPLDSLKLVENGYKQALLSWLADLSLRPSSFVVNRIKSLFD